MAVDLKGKIALVTGASRGIGQAIALALAKEGVDVAVNFRARRNEAEVVCDQIEKIGRRTIAVGADVSSAAEVSRLIETVQRELGTISILVNNAAIIRPRPLEEITEQIWDEVIAVNLKSQFLVTQAVLPSMRARKWGRIINLSSVAAQVGGWNGPHYAASKAGIFGLTHAYASLLIKEGITVNVISPAMVVTEMVTGNPNLQPSIIPMGRFGLVEEVAEVAVMLARNGYITGQTYNVNGGLYLS
jgi:3-oxoacyl-[acyl-carrier protein] reductase